MKNNRNILYSLIIILAGVIYFPVWAQQKNGAQDVVETKNVSTSQGPNRMVCTIKQDRKGNIWLLLLKVLLVKLNGNDLHVIGVVKDIIWDSPYEAEKPMVINFNRYNGYRVNMRLNPANSLSQNVELISAVAKRLNPAYPVEMKFVNNLYAQKMQSEKILGILANLLAVSLYLFPVWGFMAGWLTVRNSARRNLVCAVYWAPQ